MNEQLELLLRSLNLNDPRIFDAVQQNNTRKFEGELKISQTVWSWVAGVLQGFNERPRSAGAPDAFFGALRDGLMRALIRKVE